MQNEQKNVTFNYTYSAKEQEELKAIRDKYVKREDKMETLRRMDAAVNSKATVWSLVVGIIGALIMGTGMCCTMVFPKAWFVPGIIIGIIGIAILIFAYPTYKKVITKERERIAPEIIRLTDELIFNSQSKL